MNGKIWSLLSVFSIILCTCWVIGCVNEPAATSSKNTTGSGAVAVIPNEGAQRIGLNQTVSKVQLLKPVTSIFSITSVMPDIDGKSEKWLILAKQGNAKKFIEVDKNRVLINNWNGAVPDIEITEKNIILPENLFIKHKNRLMEYLNSGYIFESLELKNNIYTLNLKNGANLKVFSFNAENGEFISG
jgi:hypothetical protein